MVRVDMVFARSIKDDSLLIGDDLARMNQDRRGLQGLRGFLGRTRLGVE